MRQSRAGTLKNLHRDKTASRIDPRGIRDVSGNQPFMRVQNLGVRSQGEGFNSPDHIVPDSAESWAVERPTRPSSPVKLRQGRVKWHDGSMVTTADVKCSWNAVGDGKRRRRSSNRPQEPSARYWYITLTRDVPNTTATTRVTFNLGRPPAMF